MSKNDTEQCDDNMNYLAGLDETMAKIYDSQEIESGWETRGHNCLNKEDKKIEKAKKCSLLYGEIHPEGLNRAVDEDHLDITTKKTVYDLGMGTGKSIIRLFLEYKNITRAVGVELSLSRFNIAERAVIKLHNENKKKYKICRHTPNELIQIRETIGFGKYRNLILKCGDLFDEKGIGKADAIIFNTDIPNELYSKLYNYFLQVKKGCVIMSYLDLNHDCFPEKDNNILKQFNINKNVKRDVFVTSWSKSGHHFFFWERIKLEAKTKLKDLMILAMDGLKKKNKEDKGTKKERIEQKKKRAIMLRRS